VQNDVRKRVVESDGWTFTHLAWVTRTLAVGPLDECGRNLIPDDHDSQDPVIAQKRGGAGPGSLNRGVPASGGRKIGRGSSPHSGDQSEHGVNLVSRVRNSLIGLQRDRSAF
jgi:hypothetical protein